MLARAAVIKQSGVNLIVLLALSHSGHPVYEAKHAEAIASLGCPVFACTPDQFPSMMASALAGKNLQSWAAEQDVASSGDLEGEHVRRALTGKKMARLPVRSK